MAMAIELYDAPGAIALAQVFDYGRLDLLIAQTIHLRKDPEEIRREETQRWLEENKDAQFILKNDDGTEELILLEEFV